MYPSASLRGLAMDLSINVRMCAVGIWAFREVFFARVNRHVVAQRGMIVATIVHLRMSDIKQAALLFLRAIALSWLVLTRSWLHLPSAPCPLLAPHYGALQLTPWGPVHACTRLPIQPARWSHPPWQLTSTRQAPGSLSGPESLWLPEMHVSDRVTSD